jgi:hypothetical protein
MQSANSTISRILTALTLVILFNINGLSQENSPYSRYGLGDLVNHSSILNRGMGGISIGYANNRFLNTDNPASYAHLGFNLGKGNGNLITYEVGAEYNSKTLIQKTPIGKYNSKNLLFNYMQIGMQVGKKGNWGFAAGLQPYTRESYKIVSNSRISNVDSVQTVYDGSGGSYKGFIGTGYKVKNFTFGINTGYLFGKKDVSTNLRLINDSVAYYESSSNTKTSYGNVYLQTGLLYDITVKKNQVLRLGATYELQDKLRANQDIERLVYDTDNNSPNGGVDSIFVKKDVAGTIIFPSTIGFGLTYEKLDEKTGAEFLAGADFSSTAWKSYRFYGQPDQLQNSWAVKTGLQWTPSRSTKGYWNSVTYRTGFNYGKDYVKVGANSLPVYSFTLGLGLPVPTNSRIDKTALQPAVNLFLEVGKRGNTQVNLRENFVKVGLSVSLADIWFRRYKYD